MSLRPRPARNNSGRLAVPDPVSPQAAPSSASERLAYVVGVGAARMVDADATGLKIHDGKTVKKLDGLPVGVYATDIAKDLHRVPGQDDAPAASDDMLLLSPEDSAATKN